MTDGLDDTPGTPFFGAHSASPTLTGNNALPGNTLQPVETPEAATDQTEGDAPVALAVSSPAQAPAAPTQADTTPKTPLVERTAAGTFSPDLFSNAPADAVKRFILTRAGISPKEPVVVSLADVRLDDTSPDLLRVPEVFPPAGYDQPLSSVADWLACIDACKRVPAPPAKPDPRAKAAE